MNFLIDAKTNFERIESKCVNDVLRGSAVVVTSCIGAGAEPLKVFASKEQIRFSTVLIDEGINFYLFLIFYLLSMKFSFFKKIILFLFTTK